LAIRLPDPHPGEIERLAAGEDRPRSGGSAKMRRTPAKPAPIRAERTPGTTRPGPRICRPGAL